jgi:alpha-tubulin suppressor-like RCC1 family protein
MRAAVACVVAVFMLANAVAAQSTFAALSAGDRFTCGLSPEGRAYCWGSDVVGQLGIGAPVDRCDESIFAKGPCSRTPVAVAGEHRFVAISAGDNHACAIDNEGGLYCWGENHFGQLGVPGPNEQCVREASRNYEANTNVACIRTPVLVPLDETVTAVGAGEYHTCAAGTSGAVWCWGVNGSPPTQLELDQPLKNIDAGGDYTCGVTFSHELRCWSWPQAMSDGIDAPADSNDWDTVTVGKKHGCAIDSGGSGHCWGSDADGALGIGSNSHGKYDEVPVTPVLGGQVFQSIETGPTRSCGIDTGGALYCWGRVPESKGDDQCLDSNGIWKSNDCTTSPLRVDDELRFSAVAVGGAHLCGVTTSGSVRCWGANESGQLGDGTSRSTGDFRIFSLKGLGLLLGLMALGVLAYFGAILFGKWWREGARASVDTGGPAGVGALVAVGGGWALFLLAYIAVISSGPQDEVGGGLAMFVLLVAASIGLAASAVALVISVVILRRNRSATTARIAVVLASLTLMAGLITSLIMFWPRER